LGGTDITFTATLNDVFLEPNYDWKYVVLPVVHDYKLTLYPQTTPLLGDYNGSGTVDAADYTVWKDNLGGDISVLHGNGVTTTTAVSAADYALWKNHFGQSTASGSGADHVPEPTTLLLTLLALVAAPLRVRCG